MNAADRIFRSPAPESRVGEPTVDRSDQTSLIIGIMAGFAKRTGLADSHEKPRRYLWTDAFAVCNYLGLFQKTGDEGHLEMARRLIDQVHRVLGRHREDDPRQGWISGLGEEEGARHPTRGGLRIGKRMNERKPDEPYDGRLEWDRDGQYFHYLTKWMHALERMARVSGDAKYHRWAVELAELAISRFHFAPFTNGKRRLHWKMSIDLTFSLVPSTGQHDPLDGLITDLQLQAGGAKFGGEDGFPDLGAGIEELVKMCDGAVLQTTDALGIGGILTDACRLAQLIAWTGMPESGRLARLLGDAEASLEAWGRGNPLSDPVAYRLAFREFGLSIGLHAVGKMRDVIERYPDEFSKLLELKERLSGFSRFLPWIRKIEEAWLRPENQRGESWMEHLEINSVMLATSLDPGGYLNLD